MESLQRSETRNITNTRYKVNLYEIKKIETCLILIQNCTE